MKFPSFNSGKKKEEEGEKAEREAAAEQPHNFSAPSQISRRTLLRLGPLGLVVIGAGYVSYTCDQEMREEAKKYAKRADGNLAQALTYWELAQNDQENMVTKAQYIQLIRAELRLYHTNMTYASKSYLYAVQHTSQDTNALSDRELLDGSGIPVNEFEAMAKSLEHEKLVME